VKSVAFLFDNDGVLIDSSALHWRSWQMLMAQVPDFKMDKQGFESSFGMRNDLILQRLLPDASPQTRKQWGEQKEELFRQIAKDTITLLPGMEPFLAKVVAAHIPHIIASSTPLANLEMYINSTVLGKYFEHYLSAEQVAHGKPAPDIFIAAAHHLGFDPKQCIVFEDAPAGIQAGKAAGCFVVALATTHRAEQLSDYDLIYPSAHELNLSQILNAFNPDFSHFF
jgi:HAD superfamily hydrolase (TIGR01509 family)